MSNTTQKQLTLEEFKPMLDDMIRHYRQKVVNATSEDRLISECYIDAYQSVRKNFYGEVLPKE